MRGLTERQYQRRENILSAARRLIAERGYEGVTMRDLARESGVAPKTLYHQFESKEKLLRTAVEERFRHAYQTIDDAHIDKGIDRLYYIVETVADTTRKNLAYAQALAPILSERSSSQFAAIRMSTYRKAIRQIYEEDDFVDWIDVELMTALIYRQVNPLYVSWLNEHGARATLDVTRMDISLILGAVTTGYTHRTVMQMVRRLQPRLKKTSPL